MMRSTSSLLGRLQEECYELPPVEERRCKSSGAVRPDHANRHPKVLNRPNQQNDDRETSLQSGLSSSRSRTRETLYFLDGKRRIDFVLAFEEGDYRKQERRKMFESHLLREGLQMEIENKSLSQDGKTFFLKLHASWDVLTKYAEFLNMKMPIKCDNEEEETDCSCKSIWNIWCLSTEGPFMYNRELIPDEPQYVTCVFSRQQEKQFVNQDQETFFSFGQRSRIVWEILLRTSCDDGRRATGITHLLSNGTYLAAYPLHDGPYGKGAFKPEVEEKNERRLLYSEWARPASWYKRQPLNLIRRYFGEKTGLYFAWLGFYTTMLIPPAGLGVLTMFYGVSTMETNIPSQEICNENGSGGHVMCPLCDKQCDYWQLKDGCLFSRVVHLFDNPATVGFAVFMSLWATMFMELWKRKQATIAWEWDLADFDHEQEIIRPEYESTVVTYRLNPVTMTLEPFLPFWSKVGRLAGAHSAVLFMLIMVLGAMFGVIVYRIAILAALHASNHLMWRHYAKLTTSTSAALLNLLVIIIMDKIYRIIATKLTNIEKPRTQREYEDSFTFKMFLFEFINMYSSLIYIAFFKGRFFGHPGDTITLFGYRQDQCELGGCLFEVCIQLAVVMVGKQILNNITELFYTKIMNWWRQWWRGREGLSTREATTRWEQDYNLLECDRMALFDEYLEMVIQFGFVTLFVAAFPLAPLFALLNNIVEIRLDAYKYVTQLRRPVIAQVPNIGAWQAILKAISALAVISNAFMIAYTSDFIPRLVYTSVYSSDGTLWGYINNSLSRFNTSDFPDKIRPLESTLNNVTIKICRYQDYRYPPEEPKKYKLSMEYWHIFAARLSFVVVFEHLVFFFTGLVAYLIPDIPRSVQQKIQRQRYLAREALHKAELEQNRRNLSNMTSAESTERVIHV